MGKDNEPSIEEKEVYLTLTGWTPSYDKKWWKMHPDDKIGVAVNAAYDWAIRYRSSVVRGPSSNG